MRLLAAVLREASWCSGTSRYRRPTLAPDKDQRRGATDAFVAWLSACRDIGAPMQGVLRSWPCRSTPEDVCQGRRRGSKRGKDADPDGISQAELLSQDDFAVQDAMANRAMARCGATGSKVVTDGGQAKERFAMSPMHGLTNMAADGMPMPCDGRHAWCLLTTWAGGDLQQRFDVLKMWR